MKTETHPHKMEIYSNFYIDQSFSFVSIRIHQKYFGLCPPYLPCYKDYERSVIELIQYEGPQICLKKPKKTKKVLKNISYAVQKSD